MTKAELIKLVENEKAYALWDLQDAEWKQVAIELERDESRWYATAVNIYECDDGFVGVRGVCQIYSVYTTPEDIDFVCTACEYEPKTVITYVMKENRED